MGCYGIGVGRTVAAAIEQNHDKDGITFPIPISPFEVVILPNRDGRFTGYQSLEEAQRWIHRDKEREGTGQGGKRRKKRGVKGGRVTFSELMEAEKGLQEQLGLELAATNLHSALHAIGGITGDITREDLLKDIFSRFCVGK